MSFYVGRSRDIVSFDIKIDNQCEVDTVKMTSGF